LSSLETLKEACVSDRRGLRNQASFSVVLLGKCPNFARLLTMQMLRAFSQLNLPVFISIYLVCFSSVYKSVFLSLFSVIIIF
jgi:hypothetical protein